MVYVLDGFYELLAHARFMDCGRLSSFLALAHLVTCCSRSLIAQANI